MRESKVKERQKMAEDKIESEDCEESVPWDGGYVPNYEKVVDGFRKPRIELT